MKLLLVLNALEAATALLFLLNIAFVLLLALKHESQTTA